MINYALLYINVVWVLAAGCYITFLHWKARRFEFHRALFEATWEAAWDHCEAVDGITEELKDLVLEVEDSYRYQQLDIAIGMLDDENESMKGILNCEADPEITFEVEDD